MHYQLSTQGATTPAHICQQNVVPGQLPGECAVAFFGSGGVCYLGAVPVSFNSNLQPITTPGTPSSPSKPSASVIAPAVVIPVVVLLALLALLALVLVRRKKQQREQHFDNLAAPLAAENSMSSRRTASVAASLARDSVEPSGASGMASRRASEIKIQLPPPSPASPVRN